MKIKNIKYTCSALILAASLSLTGCGEDKVRTEEEVINEIFELEQELQEIRAEKYPENAKFIKEMLDLPGVDMNWDSYDLSVRKISVSRKLEEEEFITILNGLNSSACCELEQLTMEDCDLSEYSQETKELFQNVLSNLTSTKLESLTLCNMQLEDVSFLKNPNFQESLRSLSLSSNQITDISSISNLKNLRTVRLINNNVSDISALSNLRKLEKAQLYYNNITDFEIANELISDGVEMNGLDSQKNPNELQKKSITTNTFRIETDHWEDIEIGDEGQIIMDGIEIYDRRENKDDEIEIHVQIKKKVK